MTEPRDPRNPPPEGSGFAAFPLRRREVLLAGSAVAIAPAWAFARPAGSGAESDLAAAAGPLSVGYLAGSDALLPPRYPVPATGGEEEPPALDGGLVVPAVSLAAGDPRLAGGGARIRLQGFYPAAIASKRLPDDLRLDILVRDEMGVSRPFHAWSYRHAAGASPPIRFRSWLDEADPLVVRIERRGADRARLLAELTLGTQAGLPRLQTGVYFLGLEPGAWDVERTLPGPGEPDAPGLLSVVMTVESVSADA